MSNQVLLDAVEFHYKNGDTAYGFILTDDYGQFYDNGLPQEVIDLHDLDLLKRILKVYTEESPCPLHEGIVDLLVSIVINEKGITINQTYYSWEQIKDYFKGTCVEEIIHKKEKEG